MKNNKQKYIIGALALLPLLTTGCKESWLDPKPLSFYTPENTYVDAEGMYSAIVACERNMRHEFFGDQSPILTEYYTSDVAVNGKTDESGALVDFDNYMLPTKPKIMLKTRCNGIGMRFQGNQICQYRIVAYRCWNLQG